MSKDKPTTLEPNAAPAGAGETQEIGAADVGDAGALVTTPATGEVLDAGRGVTWDFAALAQMSAADRAEIVTSMLGESDVIDVDTITGNLSVIAKNELCGVPFVVIDYWHHDSDRNPRGFWSAVVIRMDDGEMRLFNDGGVGIAPTLEAAEEKGHKMLRCTRGLRKSEYPATAERPAGTTYYFA